jgi:hypothetical protein
VPDLIQKEIIRTSPLAMAASTGAAICTSWVRCGFLVTSMRSAFENGWPFTSAVDIFENSPALALSRNADVASAGSKAWVPVCARGAAQASAANPALKIIAHTRFMIVALPSRIEGCVCHFASMPLQALPPPFAYK